MMKKWLFLILILAGSVSVFGAYSPNTVITDPAGSNQANVSSAGALKVDGSAVTQPVSISGSIPISSASTLPVSVVSSLPAGSNAIGSVSQGTPGPVSSPWPVALVSPNPLPITAPSALPMKAPVNANATLSSRQTVTGTETNLAAPSNAVAAIIECESVNADNLRWGFSNSSTAILSTTLGILCEPGRSENIPVGAGTYLHMISTGSGSDYIDAQWVLSQ